MPAQGRSQPVIAVVRRARVDEADKVADVYIRSRAAAVPAVPPAVHPPDDIRRHFRERVLPEREVWVAVEDDRVVALLVLDGDELDQLYVEPGATGRGLGTRLVEVAKGERPRHLALWAFQSNTGARRFYERHGFVATAETDGDNEEGAPDVRYEWNGSGR